MKSKKQENNAGKGHNTCKRYNFDRIIDNVALKEEKNAKVDVLHWGKDDKKTHQVNVKEHQNKVFTIMKAHAIHYPRTVMIHI